MRIGSGYGLASREPSLRTVTHASTGVRRPVTARGRQVLEHSRRRGLKSA